MALSVPFEATAIEEPRSSTGILLSPINTAEQKNYDFAMDQRLDLDSSIDTQAGFFLEDDAPQLKSINERIESSGFAFNYPWLPLTVMKLLSKTKKGPLTEKELLTLMQQVSQRAAEHFGLPAGSFVALTFQGRVVEVSDTRIGLLKKLQSRKYKEQVFVSRIGFDAFSGRT